MRPLDKAKERGMARERIDALFDSAQKVAAKDLSLASRYVTLARNLSMRFKVRIPREYKRRFCKHCYHYLVSGRNARIRTREGKVVIYCLDCKKFTRIPTTRSTKLSR